MKTGERPNVLLITADQLRYDAIEPNSGSGARTPHLARLAAEGMRFVRAFSHFPVCGPARSSMLCGRRPESFGGLWNPGGALPVAELAPEAWTWPDRLRRAGYRTGLLGVWGVSRKHGPERYGYEEVVSEAEYRRFAASAYPDVTYRNGFFGEPNPIPVEDAPSRWFAEKACGMLREYSGSGRPWHLALHFHDPHLPCRPAGRFAHMYDPAAIPPWPSFAETFEGKPYIQKQQLLSWGIEDYEWKDWAPVVARYYGAVSEVDEAVGRVLAELDALGEADNTIVVFTADHGDMCGAHRMMDKHYILYDDVVHVPMIVRWPGVVPAGSTCGEFVYSFLDLAPTWADLLGLDEPEGGFHGRSLLPLLSNGTAPEWRDVVVSTYNGQQFGLYCQRMIRTERWKYVWNLTDVDELYDLAEDPAELRNRIADEALAGTLAGLRRALYEQLKTFDGLDNGWTRRQLLEGKKLARS